MYAIFNRTVSISHYTGGTEQKVFEYVPGALSLHSKTDVCSSKCIICIHPLTAVELNVISCPYRVALSAKRVVTD